jgi:iron(II)-dependent oxidoreductase
MGFFSRIAAKDTRPEAVRATRGAAPGVAPPPRVHASPTGAAPPSGDPLAQALHWGRFGVVATQPQRWGKNPGFAAARNTALAAIDDIFALVPEGFASVAMVVNGEQSTEENDTETGAFLLARCAVTNADFQRFVDSGGYEEFENWPESVAPHIVSFKDRTGKPGPRLWRDGRHDGRLSDHPVIGVSQFEADAYARWAGYRLPTEAEWQMAASWRIRSEANVIRRYPWGDALDLECCNIWHSGHATTLPAHACPAGAAPNGVLQLVGNVWEWTASDFVGKDAEGRAIVGDMLMKAIRGGAFDTYFPWQATSLFRSGAPCLTRALNIGFRCAMDLIES